MAVVSRPSMQASLLGYAINIPEYFVTIRFCDLGIFL